MVPTRAASRRSSGSEGVVEPEPRAGADDLEDIAFEPHQGREGGHRNHGREPLEPAREGSGIGAAGHSTCQAKKTARLTTTHHRGGDAGERRAELESPWVASTSGAPQRMNRNDGRKVKKVTTPPPRYPRAAADRAEDFLGRGADEAHEGHYHDERSGRGVAERQAVDHLAAGEPAVVLHRALVDNRATPHRRRRR
jgi:hypothetical protein